MNWFFRRRRSGATPLPRSPGVRPTPRAAVEQPEPRQRFRLTPRAYLAQHLQALFYSLGQMWRAPVATSMTIVVIGITLALPTVLYLLLERGQEVSAGWDGGSQVTLLLKQEVTDDAGRALASRLQAWPAVAEVRTISRAEALAEFRQLSGFGAALDALGENPLPTVITLRLAADAGGTANQLHRQLQTLPEVDLAQFDEQWLLRLYAMLDVISRGVLLLAILFSLAVLFIIGNTLRLAVQNRLEEIEVSMVVGASDAFIRRPFLYSGMWHGALGGICACVMVAVALWLMQGPVQQLVGLYQGGVNLSGLGFGVTLVLVAGGALLGLVGAWLFVGRHLAEARPV